jgi:phosphoglycolate phosphatase-like HAD superfamily hydrolase
MERVIPKQIRDMIRTYRRLYTDAEFHYIRIYPGVTETLQFFHEKTLPYGADQTKFRESALPSLRHFGFGRWRNASFHWRTSNIQNRIPNPLFARLDSLHSQNAIMDGDTPADILRGKMPGFLTLRSRMVLQTIGITGGATGSLDRTVRRFANRNGTIR